MLTPPTAFPICTIANTPRLPEHCIEWASVLEWPKVFRGLCRNGIRLAAAKRRAQIRSSTQTIRNILNGFINRLLPEPDSSTSKVSLGHLPKAL